MVIRLLWLLRMVRALRVVPMLSSAWRMVIGLIESWSAIMSMLLLTTLFLYLLACLGIELITKSESVMQTVTEHDLVTNFESISMIMLTLVQFVTLDSCAGIYFPPINNHPVLVMYFFPVVLIVSISLMNLFTAVLVEGGLALARDNLDEKRYKQMQKIKQLEPEVKDFFDKLDPNDTGTIQLLALEHMPPGSLPQAIVHRTTTAVLTELYEELNADASTEITKTEFVGALLSLCLRDSDVILGDTEMLLKIVRATRDRSNGISVDIGQIKAEFVGLKRQFTTLIEMFKRSPATSR